MNGKFCNKQEIGFMQPTLCSRCKKNMAVIFITRMDGSGSHNEGLCLKCAHELHIQP